MNEARADSFAPGFAKPAAQPENQDEKWSRKRWLTSILLVFAVQTAIIFALGERRFPPMRAVTNVPQLALADSSSELIALDDPTLFVLPHDNDFATVLWSKIPAARQPSMLWTEPPRPLPLATKNLGALFTRFMQTNVFEPFQLDFKPSPKLSQPVLTVQPMFAQNSTLRIEGELAQRELINSVSLPSWPYADVIAPSRVQVLVNANGEVISAILLPSDNPAMTATHYDAADQRAVQIARTLRFAPAPSMSVGQLIFDWQTVPPPATNSPATPVT